MEDLCQCNVRGPQWDLTYFSYRPLNNNLLTCSLSVSLKLYILLIWVNRYWSQTSLRAHASGSLRRRARRNGCFRRLCIRLETQNSNCYKKNSCKGKLSRHFTEEWSTCSPPNFQYLLVLLLTKRFWTEEKKHWIFNVRRMQLYLINWEMRKGRKKSRASSWVSQFCVTL